MATPEYDEWIARSHVRAEHEALRRIALAAVRDASSAAPALAQSYANLCAREFAAAYPTVWPRRTAGDRLRVVVLVATAPAPDAGVALDVLAGLPHDEFDVTIACLGDTVTPDSLVGIGAAGKLRALRLAPLPDANDARRLAALDPDLLFDLVGLAAATGPLLAQRPARSVATTADLGARNVAPLIATTVASTGEIRRWLDELQACAARYG